MSKNDPRGKRYGAAAAARTVMFPSDMASLMSGPPLSARIMAISQTVWSQQPTRQPYPLSGSSTPGPGKRIQGRPGLVDGHFYCINL